MCGRHIGVAVVLALALVTSGCAEGSAATGFGAPSSSTGPATSSPPSRTASSTPGSTAASTGIEELPAFSASISTVSAGRLGASYRTGCPVPPDALRLVQLSYVTFDGLSAIGELIVAAEVADDVVAIFAELYRSRFPIRSMATVEAFGADDNTSMAFDNTSAFNCRPITGGGGWSQHSYGVAIDVNPRENPYVSGATVLPPEGRDYLDRSRPLPGMILAGDPVVTVFATHGFDWGGNWTYPVDYQHFERN